MPPSDAGSGPAVVSGWGVEEADKELSCRTSSGLLLHVKVGMSGFPQSFNHVIPASLRSLCCAGKGSMSDRQPNMPCAGAMSSLHSSYVFSLLLHSIHSLVQKVGAFPNHCAVLRHDALYCVVNILT